MFADVYRGKRVLITGHTGFKGSWLCAWLKLAGAELCGISLETRTDPCHYDLLGLDGIRSETQDIRDLEKLKCILGEFQPEIIFHLAAQPLVRYSYLHPVETFATNILGMVNLLEAVRETESVRAVVAVTSDKCYENRNLERGYRESDPMGGYDPYSASKGCAELVISSYRRSFFAPEEYGRTHHLLLASARAGNVIGGGDWAEDRLVPNLMKSASLKRIEPLRNPGAVRPWQHVLEPLSGYLLLGQRLMEEKKRAASPWNFGPAETEERTVLETAGALQTHWDRIRFRPAPDGGPHEASKLKLSSAKAHRQLHWRPVWDTDRAMERTALWYRDYYTCNKINTDKDLQQYLSDAEQEGLIWTK